MIDFILRPIRRRFGKDRKFYAAIDDMFGFIPHNIELYKLALIHKSASVTLDDGRQINNERLEFLGDAVIESVTSDYLFIEFPDQNEGFLTQLRSKMVSRQSLNEVAKRLKLDTHVITHSSASFSQKHIYGDAFEAMMGAIYLDQGYDFVNRLLINRIFGDYLRTGALLEEETDFKSRLIEWCQKNHHTIRFITSHDRTYSSSHPVFICKVLIDDIEAGYGSGDSKKEAEQHAAFSVSQGFREEDCAKLFDRLDAIERGLEPSRQQRRQNDRNDDNTRNAAEPQGRKTEKAEKAEKAENGKSEKEDNAQTANAENAESEANAPKSSSRSRSSRRARRRAAAAAAAETNTAETDTADAAEVNRAENMDQAIAADMDVNPAESVSEQAAAESTTDAETGSAYAPDTERHDTYTSENNDSEPRLSATDTAEEVQPENTQTQETDTPTAEETRSEEPAEAAPTSEQKSVGRSRQRRSRRKAATQTAESEATQQDTAAEQAETSADGDNVAPAPTEEKVEKEIGKKTEEKAEDKPATTKRRSRRRTKAAAADTEIFEVAVTEITESAPQTASSENTETVAEAAAAAQEGATPKRRPRRRQSKAAKASAEKSVETASETMHEGAPETTPEAAAPAAEGKAGASEGLHTDSVKADAAEMTE